MASLDFPKDLVPLETGSLATGCVVDSLSKRSSDTSWILSIASEQALPRARWESGAEEPAEPEGPLAEGEAALAIVSRGGMQKAVRR